MYAEAPAQAYATSNSGSQAQYSRMSQMFHNQGFRELLEHLSSDLLASLRSSLLSSDHLNFAFFDQSFGYSRSCAFPYKIRISLIVSTKEPKIVTGLAFKSRSIQIIVLTRISNTILN